MSLNVLLTLLTGFPSSGALHQLDLAEVIVLVGCFGFPWIHICLPEHFVSFYDLQQLEIFCNYRWLNMKNGVYYQVSALFVPHDILHPYRILAVICAPMVCSASPSFRPSLSKLVWHYGKSHPVCTTPRIFLRSNINKRCGYNCENMVIYFLYYGTPMLSTVFPAWAGIVCFMLWHINFTWHWPKLLVNIWREVDVFYHVAHNRNRAGNSRLGPATCPMISWEKG